MRMALGIVRLFPEGGLQRHCLDMARALLDRGHEVTIFTSSNLCDIPQELGLRLLPVRALTNHGRDWAFARKFQAAVAGRFDRIVGFNKLMGLDFLYCADPSVEDPPRGWSYRQLPRHRARLKLEGESFAPRSATHIITLTHSVAEAYRRYWGTGMDRFTIIPPVMDPARRQYDLRLPDRRNALRAALHIPPDRPVWLWIGAKPHTKGLDRVIAALATKPDVLLLVVGVIATRGEGRRAAARVRRLGLFDRVRFYGYCEDIPNFLAVSDLLVHPARLDVTGQVILEAILNGLPAVVSACCGFAEHVRAANAGIVLPEPFKQDALEAALTRVQEPGLADTFSRNGIEYGREIVTLNGITVAADVIENGPQPLSPRPGTVTGGPPAAADISDAAIPQDTSVAMSGSPSLVYESRKI